MLKLVTPPAVEPVSVADAQEYLRVDPDLDAALIGALITTARRTVESYTGLSLINTVWEYSLDAAQLRGTSLALPRAPLASVASITYYNADGTSGTFSASSYYADAFAIPGRIVLYTGSTWPTALRERASLIVRFTAGYGSAASSVPADLCTAIKMLCGLAYEERLGNPAPTKYESMASGGKLPPNVAAMIEPYKVYWL